MDTVDFAAISGGKTSTNVLWLDLETTCLDPRRAKILEIAAVITDSNFNELARFERVIQQDQKVWGEMSEWSKQNHKQLWEECLRSTHSLESVEKEFAEFVDAYRKDHRGHSKKFVLAGSSVVFDRDCLVSQMPALRHRITYKTVDVTGFMEVFKRLFPSIRPPQPAQPTQRHRAMVDVCNSLNLLHFYLKTFVLPSFGVFHNGYYPHQQYQNNLWIANQ